MKKLLTMTLLALSMGLTSCNDAAGVPDNPTQPEVTLEDALIFFNVFLQVIRLWLQPPEEI